MDIADITSILGPLVVKYNTGTLSLHQEGDVYTLCDEHATKQFFSFYQKENDWLLQSAHRSSPCALTPAVLEEEVQKITAGAQVHVHNISQDTDTKSIQLPKCNAASRRARYNSHNRR